MAQRRGFPPRQTAARRRINKWSLGPNSTSTTLSATSKQLWTNGVVLVDETQVTLVRIRGDMELFLTANTAAGDGFFGAVAIGMTTVEAVAAGVASLPGPQVDADWDGWIWHRFFNILGAGSTDGEDGPSTVQRIEVDSKAMRKWSNGYIMFGIIEKVEQGTAVGEMFVDTRMLVKLS